MTMTHGAAQPSIVVQPGAADNNSTAPAAMTSTVAQQRVQQKQMQTHKATHRTTKINITKTYAHKMTTIKQAAMTAAMGCCASPAAAQQADWAQAAASADAGAGPNRCT